MSELKKRNRPPWRARWAPRGYLAWRRAKQVAEASQRTPPMG